MSNGRIIGGCPGECLGGQGAAGCQHGVPTIGGDLGQNKSIIIRAYDNRDAVMILGGSADHGGTTHINVLDGFVPVRMFCHGCFKGIKVDYQQINVAYVMRGLGRLMRGVAANAQKPAMDLGVQGFYPPIHDLGKARDV